MNNATRKQIALKTDKQLDDDISRYERQAIEPSTRMGGLYRQQQARIQAHYDEKQARMVGESAVYDYTTCCANGFA